MQTSGMPGATLAIDPTRITIGVVLFFPDWQPDLQLVDDISAGQEGLITVG